MTLPARVARSSTGLVASSDALATAAGVSMLRHRGTAADAAVAAGAVLAVTAPYACGLGGDLFAIVHGSAMASPRALTAAGASGSGADAGALRAEGRTTMPYQGDVRSTTVPGCVDGWTALHDAFGTLPMDYVLTPAIDLAQGGFPISAVFAGTLAELAGAPAPAELADLPPRDGAVLRRPGVARALGDIAAGGREAFYGGEFGQGLLDLGAGLYSPDDLARSQCRWEEPLSVDAFGHRIWTSPPPSQGYITLLALAVADRLGLPADPDDPAWVHLIVESVVAAGWDRPAFLHEGADARSLLDATTIAARADLVDRDARSAIGLRPLRGDTTYLCAVDRDGLGVSLIQSNAAGYGSHLFEPSTGIHLQNRGIGFSLVPGHPAEFGPVRRPPHTLCPTLVTDGDGRLRALVGCAGGDAQPQVVLQLLARWLAGTSGGIGEVLSAPRFRLGALAGTGFDTWSRSDGTGVLLEQGAPHAWVEGLRARGHAVDVLPVDQAYAGQGQFIGVTADGAIGAAEPRVAHSAVAAA